MRLTVLGAGTMAPKAEYGMSGHVVSLDADGILLFDCGSGTLQRGARAGIDWLRLERVFISHLHPDHTLDLPALTFALNHAPGVPPGARLDVYGPAGLGAFFEKVCAAWPAAAPKNFELKLRELSPGDMVATETWAVRAGTACHGKGASLAWRVESDGRALVYSGDTQYCPEITKLACGCDLLLCECSTDDSHCLEGHLSPSGVARLVRDSGAARAVLVHVYPPFDPLEMAARCAEFTGVTVE
ncbi:ribonuclease Z, partial [bacterium]|nr:ribonuclease Z [bacterium]